MEHSQPFHYFKTPLALLTPIDIHVHAHAKQSAAAHAVAHSHAHTRACTLARALSPSDFEVKVHCF